MEGSRQKSERIRQFILENISLHAADIVKTTAQRFAITRQAAARHIKKLIIQGDIEAEGNTSGRLYRPSRGYTAEFAYAPADAPDERTIWEKDIRPQLQSLSPGIIERWSACFQSVFRIVKDHSPETGVLVRIVMQKTKTTIKISENGNGLFKTIQRRLHLPDEEAAAIQLARGMAAAGEGAPIDRDIGDIVRAARILDQFTVSSGKVLLCHHQGTTWDWEMDVSAEKKAGTRIGMTLENHSGRAAPQAALDLPGPSAAVDAFPKICTPVRLVQYSAVPLSTRSQARRILTRIQKFDVAVLDFHGIKSIGPAFADQIFRVFLTEHPGIRLLYRNANKQVQAIIQAATANIAGDEPTREG